MRKGRSGNVLQRLFVTDSRVQGHIQWRSIRQLWKEHPKPFDSDVAGLQLCGISGASTGLASACSARLSCRDFSVRPFVSRQASRPLDAPPTSTPAAAEGELKR